MKKDWNVTSHHWIQVGGRCVLCFVAGNLLKFNLPPIYNLWNCLVFICLPKLKYLDFSFFLFFSYSTMFPRRTPGWVEITYVYIATNSTHLYFQWSIPGLPTAALHTWGDFAESRPARIRYEKVLIPACVPPTPAPITISGKKINKTSRCHRSSGGSISNAILNFRAVNILLKFAWRRVWAWSNVWKSQFGMEAKKKNCFNTFQHLSMYLYCVKFAHWSHSEYSLKKKNCHGFTQRV